MREGDYLMARKRIDKDFEVSIVNNLHGGFFYSSPNGDFIIDMENHGDEDYVSFGDLKSMMSRNRKFLIDLYIVINDVVGDEYTLEEVVTSLKLKDSYDELLSLSDEKLSEVDYIDIENVADFVREVETEKIAKILGNKKSKLRLTIADAVTAMHREGELSDYNIMKVVAEKLGHEDVQSFWSDIEASNG